MPDADKKYELSAAAIGEVNAELTPEERRRVGRLLAAARGAVARGASQLAERLARPLYEKYGGQYGDAEDYIERLSKGRSHES